MEMPEGWFGRPYDSHHELNWSVVRDGKLFLELDGQLHFIMIDPAIVESTKRELSISMSLLTFDWREYGPDGRRHTRFYSKGGIIRFHASPVPGVKHPIGF
jgi:hypothetical protein